MSIGAKDAIDVLLVRKYATMKVDSPIQNSMIDPNKMYEAMNDYAHMHLAMINMQQSLRGICAKAISQNIQYTKSRNLKKRAPEGAQPQQAPQQAQVAPQPAAS